MRRGKLVAGVSTLGRLGRGIGDGLSGVGFALRRASRAFRLNVPERLLIAPQELTGGDPLTAMDIYAGQMMLAGRMVQTRGQSPYRAPAPSYAWLRELHGFVWLRHFRDADNPVVRHHARALVAEWLGMREAWRNPSARLPDVAARRMMAWLTNSPLLLTDADHVFYARFMRGLARTALVLEHAASRPGLGPAHLDAAIAYAAYTLCAMTGENDWKRASRLLAGALTSQILADGCPLSRNPAAALAIASDLLPLKTAYSARGRTPPAELQTALDRIMAFLRLARHPNGDIALFNGMGATSLDHVAALLQFDDARGGGAPASARFGGYHRLERQGSVLLVDAGSCPPPAAARTAHAGGMSFELSAGHERIVVNCGTPPAGLDEMREALRETAAHSTLCVDGASSARFQPVRARDGAAEQTLGDTGARPVAERSSEHGMEQISLSHGGYARAHGFHHERHLTLSEDGLLLSGIDMARSDTRKRRPAFPGAHLRFHLHPRVTATLAADAGSVSLQLGDGAVWSFQAGGQPIFIEDSIFFGGLASQRRTRQIVVDVAEADSEIHWSFACMSGPPPQPRRG